MEKTIIEELVLMKDLEESKKAEAPEMIKSLYVSANEDTTVDPEVVKKALELYPEYFFHYLF
jgi:hypothetical protein